MCCGGPCPLPSVDYNEKCKWFKAERCEKKRFVVQDDERENAVIIFSRIGRNSLQRTYWILQTHGKFRQPEWQSNIACAFFVVWIVNMTFELNNNNNKNNSSSNFIIMMIITANDQIFVKTDKLELSAYAYFIVGGCRWMCVCVVHWMGEQKPRKIDFIG